ncbi:MAG: thioredoxin [Balneolaceae bacterium]|nr:MAG: thioredoxin [Balneolaceae bacterium]
MSYEVTDIKTDIIDASQHTPVVLDFWAEWCGPCRTLGPVIERLASKAGNRWKLVKVDLENPNNQSLAAQFQIRSIPAVRMIFQGKLLGQFDGALPEPEIKKWLDAHLPEAPPSEEEALREDFEEAIAAGDRDRALAIARKLADAEPESDELKAELALQLLPAQITEAKEVMDSLKNPEAFLLEKEMLDTIVRLAGISSGDVPLPGNGLSIPYREAAVHLMEGRFSEAAEGMINVLMADRSFEDDGARKACVALFRILGEKHPVTRDYRRRFSMALY